MPKAYDHEGSKYWGGGRDVNVKGARANFRLHYNYVCYQADVH